MAGVRQKLSWLNITGPLNSETPLVVVGEIADAHGRGYDSRLMADNLEYRMKVINCLNNNVEDDNFSDDDLPAVARFINKDERWPVQILKQALSFVGRFFIQKGESILSLLPDSYNIGLQTVSEPENVNAAILYRICRDNNIATSPTTSLRKLGLIVGYLRSGRDVLLNHIQTLLSVVDTHILINVFSHFDDYNNGIRGGSLILPDTTPRSVPNEITHNGLGSLHRQMTNLSKLQKIMRPSSYYQAVALSAINFGIDISRASNPIQEYTMFVSTTSTCPPYTDSELARIHKINPKLLNLRVTFNPLFPSDYYPTETMRRMALAEGYDQTDFEHSSAYELLQVAYLSDTFYLGRQLEATQTRTTINLTEVDEVDPSLIVCYGRREGNMATTTLDELADLIKSNRNFSNPFIRGTLFSAIAIKKLVFFCSLPASPSVAPEVEAAKAHLLQQINDAKDFANSLGGHISILKAAYDSAPEKIQELTLTTLHTLVQLAMYMRGWTGKGPYPLVKSPDTAPEDIERYTCEYMRKFSEYCHQLGDVGTVIMNLPLLRYIDGSYQISTSENNGFTIAQRLSIVRVGKSTHNVYSCIRISSNWLAASAHKYIVALNHAPPFEISELRSFY